MNHLATRRKETMCGQEKGAAAGIPLHDDVGRNSNMSESEAIPKAGEA